MGATKQKARRFIPFLVVFGITRCWACRQPNAIDVPCAAWHIPTAWDQVSDLSRTARTAPSRVVGPRKPSFAGTWMYRRLFVEVILGCNRSKESNA